MVDDWYQQHRDNWTMPIPQGNETQPVRYTRGGNQGYYVSTSTQVSKTARVYQSDHAGRPSNRMILMLCLLGLAFVVSCGWLGWLMVW